MRKRKAWQTNLMMLKEKPKHQPKIFELKSKDYKKRFIQNILIFSQTARTPVKNSTYTPEFNQLITFTEFFPPLCKRIKIQMKDSDISKNEIIGILLVFYSTVYTQSGGRISITIYTVKTSDIRLAGF